MYQCGPYSYLEFNANHFWTVFKGIIGVPKCRRIPVKHFRGIILFITIVYSRLVNHISDFSITMPNISLAVQNRSEYQKSHFLFANSLQ